MAKNERETHATLAAHHHPCPRASQRFRKKWGSAYLLPQSVLLLAERRLTMRHLAQTLAHHLRISQTDANTVAQPCPATPALTWKWSSAYLHPQSVLLLFGAVQAAPKRIVVAGPGQQPPQDVVPQPVRGANRHHRGRDPAPGRSPQGPAPVPGPGGPKPLARQSARISFTPVTRFVASRNSPTARRMT